MRRNFIALLFLALPLAAQAATPESFAPVIEPLMPAVVNISTTQKVVAPQGGVPFDIPGLPDGDPQAEQFKELFRQFGERFGGGDLEREVTSLGSGFVIDPDGYIVTNNHVVGNASEMTVIFSDNTHLPATLVGRDAKTDLALIKVKPSKKLPFVSFGDSDALKVGDWLIAVGNPFGLGGSVSAGIVSARGRNINAGPFDDFIQTDAAINRGNSGGPLFNAQGQVVGINSAIFSPTGTNIGIGFAVPTSLAKPVLDQLRKYGKAQRAWLGVKIQEVSEEIANSIGMKEAKGALLLEVTPKSPAAGSDLQPGDVIVKFDGHDIREMRNLPRLVAETPANKDVEVVVFRKGRETSLHVKLAEQKDDDGDQPPSMKPGDTGKAPAKGEGRILGMELAPIDDTLRAQFGLPKNLHGLLVMGLDRDSEIAKQGVMPGDVILDVNQNEVASTSDVKAQMEAVKKSGRNYALIRVKRGKAVQFITVPVK
jgi:serine protease Do